MCCSKPSGIVTPRSETARGSWMLDLQVDAGEEAALVAADLIAAGPDAARAFAVAVDWISVLA